MSKTQPARGMRDFLPADIRKREYVIGIIKEVYESYGFEPLETPAVENLETLTGKYGEEGNQLIFKILKRGEKLGESFSSEKDLADLALRYDLTVPLARVVAQHKNDLPKFFKRYQIQPVWRADRPARGRFREFYQCDVDAIGSSSMIVEAELCVAVSEILKRLGFSDFVIRVNHRAVLTAILNASGVPVAKYFDALTALDKIDKIGREGVTNEFIQRGVSKSVADKLLVFLESIIKTDFRNVVGKTSTEKLINLQKELVEKEKNFSIEKSKASEVTKLSQLIRERLDVLSTKLADKLANEGINEDAKNLQNISDELLSSAKHYEQLTHIYANTVILESLRDFLKTNKIDEEEGLKDLEKIIDLSEFSQISNQILIDPTLARGLSYYTGAIFEINVPDLAGSLGGGGRYDGLIGMFGKEQIPACGFSLGLERILVVMNERGMFPPELETNSADVLVTMNEESIGESLSLANELRQQGLRVFVYPEADKLGKQFKYASQINVSFVCVLGESELAENKVTLKNMRTGEQETVLRDEIAAKIASVK